MLSAFGGLALLLSAIGLYGVLAVGVGLRRREIAIRRALGAARGAVATLVVRNGLTLALGGLAAGLAGAVVASRLFTSLLYDVGRYDPITWAGAPALLLVVAAAASWLPARRATRIDPAATLRGE
jgi:ABC-type antimicrobial peptide transport system permease subunit